MLILVTNDDGIEAEGLRILAREIRKLGKVVIAAPATQKSAISSSLTLYSPVMARHKTESGIDQYAVEGTPADCVKLAVRELLPKRPDLVISGINFGLNTGSNILYSGTVAGALEGAHLGIPSYAVSLAATRYPDWNVPARLALSLIRKLAARFSKERCVYNINVPAREAGRIKGTLVTVQESKPYPDSYDRRTDPRGRTYYWLRGSPERKYRARNGDVGTPTDAWAVAQGYVSVTPIRRDLTDLPRIGATEDLLNPRG